MILNTGDKIGLMFQSCTIWLLMWNCKYVLEYTNHFMKKHQELPQLENVSSTYPILTFFTNELTNELVSSIGRALHRYRRGHGFKSRTGLNFFQVLFTTTRFSSVLSCEDLLISKHYLVHWFKWKQAHGPIRVKSKICLWILQMNVVWKHWLVINHNIK